MLGDGVTGLRPGACWEVGNLEPGHGSGAGGVLRRLPAVLHQPPLPGPRLRRLHSGPPAPHRAAQRWQAPRWGLEDQWAWALFEWAWQHPHTSRRLSHVSRRTRRETRFDFHLRVLAHMLRVAPWCRLPLTVRWLEQEYRRDFPPALQPPLHMPLAFGPVRVLGRAGGRRKQGQEELSPPPGQAAQCCTLCLKRLQDVDDPPLRCFHSGCPLAAHPACLAREFLREEPQQFLPVEGRCPGCKNLLLWGDLIRYHQGCYGDLEAVPASSQGHWTDELQS
ncbi:structure-specific endonuclease subunit SLX1 isoform X3 [Dermochelys coriacea]|uniref:structure-specific endonuclease subunit SLX1 isoform X3 n=1 Tax=Dermochelys coriacea TaxID=27794 RepID=UPI001CA8CAE7|nr:structure-specific endonuclease subunit SLX1 isoform X3 [Dermochelys coriacea]